MPPPAPSTATFVCRAELVEKARVDDKRRAAERVSMAEEREVMMWGTAGNKVQRTIGVEFNRNSPKDAELPRQHTMILSTVLALLRLVIIDSQTTFVRPTPK